MAFVCKLDHILNKCGRFCIGFAIHTNGFLFLVLQVTLKVSKDRIKDPHKLLTTAKFQSIKKLSIGLSTVPRTWCIYGARITGPIPVPSKQSGHQLYGHFCTVYVQVSEFLHKYHLFQSQDVYPCNFDTLPQVSPIICGIEGG